VSKKKEKSAGSSTGKNVGLNDAKSARYSQFQDVTRTFSHLISPADG
jgi:hypothetical protein